MTEGMGRNACPLRRCNLGALSHLGHDSVDGGAGEPAALANQEWPMGRTASFLGRPRIEIALEDGANPFGQRHTPPLVALANNRHPGGAQPHIQVFHLNGGDFAGPHTRKSKDLDDQRVTEIARMMGGIQQFCHNRGIERLGGPGWSPIVRSRRAGDAAQTPVSTNHVPSEDSAATALLSVAGLRTLRVICTSRVATYCSTRYDVIDSGTNDTARVVSIHRAKATSCRLYSPMVAGASRRGASVASQSVHWSRKG